MTPVQIAAGVLKVAPDTLRATRIKGGLTNESWLVQGAREAVVVRISTADEQALQLNRASEAVVLELVQRAGIGAEVLLWAPGQRVLVTRQLSAQTLTAGAVHELRMVRQMAGLLRRLHAVTAPPSVQQIDLLAVLNGYWRSLDMQPSARRETPEVRARAVDIAMESAGITPRCLCHNDVHHLNLLSDGQRLWLLDWEYAGIGDPLFDLASVCCYHGYDQPLRQQLLLAYRGELQAADSVRLQRMCWLFDYIKVLWLAVRELQTGVP